MRKMSNGFVDQNRSDILNPNAVVKQYPSGMGDRRFHEYVRDFERYDARQAINRFEWVNLPHGLDGQLIERILYYRGRGAMTFINGKFYFLPYTLHSKSASIDAYGRYRGISLMTFNGTATRDKKGNITHEDSIFLGGKEFTPVYEIDQVTEQYPAVPLWDGAKQLSENNVPLYIANQHFNQEKAEIVVLIRKNLVNSVKQFVVGVKDEAEVEVMEKMWNAIRKEQINSDLDITFVKTNMDIQELKGTQSLQSQDYWEAFASLDSLREMMMGINSNGVFNKKERKLESEAELEAEKSSLIQQDALYQRKRFCLLVNNTFGLAIDVKDVQNGTDKKEETSKENNEFSQGGAGSDGGQDGTNT